MMEAIRQTQKKFGSRALTTAVVLGLILVLLGHQPVAKGLILGTLFSIANFVLIGQILPMLLTATQKKSVLISFGSILFRYLLLSIPLILAMKLTNLNFIATAFGIFMVQIMVMGEHVFRLIHPDGIRGL
jgi:ATP synthase I subunit